MWHQIPHLITSPLPLQVAPGPPPYYCPLLLQVASGPPPYYFPLPLQVASGPPPYYKYHYIVYQRFRQAQVALYCRNSLLLPTQ